MDNKEIGNKGMDLRLKDRMIKNSLRGSNVTNKKEANAGKIRALGRETTSRKAK